MSLRRACVAVLAAALLAGCGAASDPAPAPTARAERLWSERTAYTGDNSRVLAVLDAAGFGPQGDYTVALRTTTPPYGATVRFSRLDKPFEDTSFRDAATLTLGLVGNLDRVEVTFEGKTAAFTAAAASKRLGYDVKQLGADRGRLDAYLRTLAD